MSHRKKYLINLKRIAEQIVHIGHKINIRAQLKDVTQSHDLFAYIRTNHCPEEQRRCLFCNFSFSEATIFRL